MCVIMIARAKGPRPTVEMTEKAWIRNSDGGGIAHRLIKDDGTTVVKWRKGLSRDEMQDLCQTVPLPYVAHWRIASSGGVIPELTHPFPVNNESSLALEGETEGTVLFHNGTWEGWNESAVMATIRKGMTVPDGEWSDTRAIAWLMSMYGDNFMKLLPTQKGVAFTPTGINVFLGGGWSDINGVLCSNDYFMNVQMKKYVDISPMCEYYRCIETDNLDSDKRCLQHPKASFPMTGRPTEVAKASPTPFHTNTAERRIISVKVAEILHRQVRSNGEKRCSKNRLKAIRKAHSLLAQGGKGAKGARTHLEKLSAPLLTLFGQHASTNQTSGTVGAAPPASSGSEKR